jgi:hypothetical protein
MLQDVYLLMDPDAAVAREKGTRRLTLRRGGQDHYVSETELRVKTRLAAAAALTDDRFNRELVFSPEAGN